MRLAALLFGLSLLCAASASAQTQLTPDEFLDRAEGRTLTFSYPDGGLVGTEQFLDRDRTIWKRPGRDCTYGQIELREDLVCFLYDDFPDVDNCWKPFTDDGRLFVVSINGSTQEITRITSTPILCGDVPIS
jgi:hypothetical protein